MLCGRSRGPADGVSATGESGGGASGAAGAIAGGWTGTEGTAPGPPGRGPAANVPCGSVLSAWWATETPSTVSAAPITNPAARGVVRVRVGL